MAPWAMGEPGTRPQRPHDGTCVPFEFVRKKMTHPAEINGEESSQARAAFLWMVGLKTRLDY